MAAPKNARGGDLTARQVNEANKKRDEEQAARAQELSMATAAAKDELENGVIDLTDPAKPAKDGESAEGDDVVEIEEVEVAQKVVSLRVNEDLEMTYAGVLYELKVGPTYKLPAHIAEWLEEKGVVWH